MVECLSSEFSRRGLHRLFAQLEARGDIGSIAMAVVQHNCLDELERYLRCTSKPFEVTRGVLRAFKNQVRRKLFVVLKKMISPTGLAARSQMRFLQNDMRNRFRQPVRALPASRKKRSKKSFSKSRAKISSKSQQRSLLERAAAALALGSSPSVSKKKTPKKKVFVKKEAMSAKPLSSSSPPAAAATATAPMLSSSTRSIFLPVFGTSLLLAFVVFAALYFRANPKECVKRACSTVQQLPENALVRVATQLNTNCTPAEKSRRVKEIIEKTLDEIDYGA